MSQICTIWLIWCQTNWKRLTDNCQSPCGLKPSRSICQAQPNEERERETQVAWNRQIECIGILPSSLARITNYGNKFLINLYELFFSPPISFVKFHLSRSPSFPPSKKGEWGEGFNLPWRFPSVTTRYTYVYIWKLACLSLNLGVPFFLSFSSNSTLHSFSFQYSITQYIISQLIIN